VDRVGYALKRAQQALRNRMDRALDGHGLTVPQYAALSALEADPELSNAELARRSFVKAQTMHQILAQLERAGLVTRRAGAGRARPGRLTSRGAAVVAAAHGAVEAVEARMLAALAPAERDQLRAWLDRCADALADD